MKLAEIKERYCKQGVPVEVSFKETATLVDTVAQLLAQLEVAMETLEEIKQFGTQPLDSVAAVGLLKIAEIGMKHE